jgi:hypothetical protein
MSGPSSNGAWWLPILEKAYAKYSNTYASLNGGNEWEALRAMTGMPVDNFSSSDLSQNEIWDIISAGDRAHYIMTAGCYNSEYGLVSGHAYTVLGVNEDTHRIVVRNPWGSEQYTGPGSDQDDDGKFEVPLDVWMNNFYEFTVMKYADWKVTNLGRQVMDSRTYEKFWNINVDQTQKAIITIDMASSRHAEQGCDETHYLSLTLGQNSPRWVVLERAQADNQHFMSKNIEMDLQPGTYSVGVSWLQGSVPQDFNLHIYSSASHIHFEDDNGRQVSTVQNVEYLGPEVAAPQPDPVTPTPGPGPSPAPAVSGDCTDGTGTDNGGDGCSWYGSNVGACGAYDTNLFAATRDCCACGGGYGDSQPPAPTPPGPSAGCTSGTGTDSGGDSCDWYASNADSCGAYDTNTFSADEQCCACGGSSGSTGGDAGVCVSGPATDSAGDGCSWYADYAD